MTLPNLQYMIDKADISGTCSETNAPASPFTGYISISFGAKAKQHWDVKNTVKYRRTQGRQQHVHNLPLHIEVTKVQRLIECNDARVSRMTCP